MKQVQQVQVALFATIALQRCFSKASLSMVSCALLVVGDMLAWSGIATAQQEPSAVEHIKKDLEAKKLRLEIEKLTNDLSLRDLERKKAEFEAEKARLEVTKFNELRTLEREKAELEVTKLNELRTLEREKAELEVTKLDKEARAFPAWLTSLLPLLLTGVGIAATYMMAKRGIFSTLAQSVHAKRLELYPELVNATAPLALHFPPQDSLKPLHCRAVGLALRTWYFEGGGIFLSEEARDAYFKLARELTRASLETKLAVPVFSKDAKHINVKQVQKYLKILDLNKQNGMEDTWTFGPPTSCTMRQRILALLCKHEEGLTAEQIRAHLNVTQPIGDTLQGMRRDGIVKVEGEGKKMRSGANITAGDQRWAYQFRDFVFLQHLSSTLRTKLLEDLRSRRRPAYPLGLVQRVLQRLHHAFSCFQQYYSLNRQLRD